MRGFNIATFNLQVFGPNTSEGEDDIVQRVERLRESDKRVLSNLPAMLEAVEEDLTKLLPPGYTAVIREWSSDE